MITPERLPPLRDIYLSGQFLARHSELVEMLPVQLRKKLRFETISQADWEENLNALSKVEQTVNADMAKHISIIGAGLKEALPADSLFSHVVGEEQESFATWSKRIRSTLFR